MAIAPMHVSVMKPLTVVDKRTDSRPSSNVQNPPHLVWIYRGEKQLLAYTSHREEVRKIEPFLLRLQTVSFSLP